MLRPRSAGSREGASLKNFLVLFQATQQSTESLALALGLGAVQSGADIRLRHLAPLPSTELAHQSYGQLKEADVRWAECVGVVFEDAEDPAALREVRDALQTFEGSEILHGKWAYVAVGIGPETHSTKLVDELCRAGLQVILDGPSQATLTTETMSRLGQELTGLAEAGRPGSIIGVVDATTIAQ